MDFLVLKAIYTNNNELSRYNELMNSCHKHTIAIRKLKSLYIIGMHT